MVTRMDYLDPSTWDITDPTTRTKLQRLDLTLNFLLFTPLIVLHYHSSTYLVECIFLNYFPRIGLFVLFIFGAGIVFCLAFFQKRLPSLVPKKGAEKQSFYETLACRIYTFVLTFGNVCHIRAVTGLYEMMTSCTAGSALRAAVTGILILWGMRAGRNIVCTPLGLCLDRSRETDHFRFTTLFSTEPDESQDSAIDVAVTVGIVHSFMHLHWAGITALLDHILFPAQPGMSALLSLLIGYVLCLAILYMWTDKAKEVSKQCEEESEMKQIAFEDFCTVVAGFAVISVWRGIWMWFDLLATKFPIYIIRKDVTPLVGCVGSYVLIVMARLSNSLPYKGCDIDGELKQGEGLTCCNDYFIHFVMNMKKEDEEKENNKENESREELISSKQEFSDISDHELLDTKDNPAEPRRSRAQRPRRRNVRAIEHAKNILAKDSSLINGTINYELTEEEMKDLDKIK